MPEAGKSSIARRINNDLKDNLILKKHGLVLLVTDEQNGFVELLLTDGPRRFRDRLNEGADPLSAIGTSGGDAKAYRDLMAVITYVKDLDYVKAVSVSAVTRTQADLIKEHVQKGMAYMQNASKYIKNAENDPRLKSLEGEEQEIQEKIIENRSMEELRKAANEFRTAANGGDAEGQFYLGYMYEGGLGVERDRKEAAKWYRLAMAQGYQNLNYDRQKSNSAALQLKQSISTYFTEYRKFPVGGRDDVTVDSGRELIAPLTGHGKSNPRKILFISIQEAIQRNDGTFLGGIHLDTMSLLDSWGNKYRVRIDANYDNSVESPESSSTKLSQSVIVWSPGPDGNFDTWKDNVKTW